MIFRKGDKAKLAGKLGVSPQYLNDILQRRRRVSPGTALRFAEISRNSGFYIPPEAWVFNEITEHPAFKPLKP